MIVIWSEIHFQNDETQETMHSVSFSSSYKYFHSFWTWYSYYVVLKVIILNDFFSIHLNIGRIFWRWQSDDAQFFLVHDSTRAHDLACLSNVSHVGVWCVPQHLCGNIILFFLLTSGFLNWLNYQIVLHLIIFPYILHALHSYINGMSVQRSFICRYLSLCLWICICALFQFFHFSMFHLVSI